jgi:Fe-S cluster assembly protein SufD
MMQPEKLFAVSSGIGEEAARAASEALAEPSTFLQSRLESLSKFDAAATQDNRYTRLALDWASMPVMAPLRLDTAAPFGEANRLSPESSLLSKRLRENPSSLDNLKGGASQWDPLVLAAWREGVSLVYESGEKRESPDYVGFGNPGGLVPEPLLMEVGERAEATLFLHWKGEGEPSLHLSLLSGIVGAGAKLKVFLLHDGPSYHHALSVNIRLMRDASAEFFGAWMGGPWTMIRARAELLEPGASWRETEMVALDKKEHLDWDVRVRHAAHHTQSDVQAKSVLAGRSRAVLTGDIEMENESVKGSARLESHVLLLSPGARADSIPSLEIKAMDLKASHAASVGKPDEQQMLYLESRGLDESQARRLVVEGFLKSLIERAPLPFAEALVDASLERKLGA